MAAEPHTIPVAPPAARAAPAPGSALLALDHEELVIRRGTRSGLYTVVAVHSTALGPSLGGCRMWHYPGGAEAARDALRLSRAMTLKAAAAGLDLGGGKGVICLPPGAGAPEGAARRDVLLDFADTVDALEGSYITAEDVGTSARDMVTIAERTRHVTGRPAVHGGSGDPSAFTAQGIEAAMRACCASAFGTPDLAGRTVAIVGCGHVGERLARRLAAAGARLVLADVDAGKRSLAAELPRAAWADPVEALVTDVDVLAPCALGGVLDEHTVPRVRARVVCGAANNQLGSDGLAADLAARGVLYAPDFVANSGGLINVAAELVGGGYDPERARARVAEVEDLMAAILAEAEADATTPLAAAVRRARRRLDAAPLR
jgi:leucine dehydrogenase